MTRINLENAWPSAVRRTDGEGGQEYALKSILTGTKCYDCYGNLALRPLHGFLLEGPLVGLNLFPAIIPPPVPVVNEYFAEAVATVLSGGYEQQECHFFDGGDDQHSLAGVSENVIL